MVVVFHVKRPYLADAPPAIWEIAAHGYVGVSLFFVLSGFILTYTYLDPLTGLRAGLRAFWIARFARIYPVYLLSLLVAFRFFLDNPERGNELKTVVALVAVPLLLQAWWPPLEFLWNTPGWTLSAEAFFYLLFPFVAPLLIKLGTAWIMVGIVACWGLALLPPLIYLSLGLQPTDHQPLLFGGLLNQPGLHFWSTVLASNPLLRLPEFLIGILVGIVFLRLPSTSTSRTAHFTRLNRLAALLAVGAIPLCLMALKAVPPELCNVLLVPLFALAIFSLAAGRDGLSWLLSRSWMVLLGEASYAMYLLHLPIWQWMHDVFPSVPLLRDHYRSPWFFSAYLASVIGVSILVFKTVEQPARRLIWKALIQGRGRSPARMSALSSTP
jgi:peptidoglycan/LPS O-acetylase OafA/YrhL